jgi:hypothetical protein
MAVQVINERGMGQNLGQSFGTGIHGLLQGLAQHKAEELSYQKNIQRQTQFWKGLGLPDQVASSFSHAPAEVQKSLLDRLEGLEIGGEAQQPSQPQGQPSFMPENLQAQQQAQQPGPEDVREYLKKLANPLYQGQQALQLKPEAVQAAPTEQKLPEGYERTPKGVLKIGANPMERRHKETLAQQKELAEAKMSARERAEARSETREFRQAQSKAVKDAKERLSDINRLEELDKDGVDSPGLNEFLTRSGFDIAALRSASGEEYNKIVNNFVRNAKSEYGARLTDADLKQFFQRLPTLSNSKEGRKRIYANMKFLERSKIARKETEREIIRENGGVPPFDLEDLVEDRIDAKLDVLAAKFREELKKPIEGEESSKLSTIAGALGGEAARIGIPAAIGAGAGSIIPGIGTTAGGAAGALYGFGSPFIKKLLNTLSQSDQ